MSIKQYLPKDHSDANRKLWYERRPTESKELNREFKFIHPSIARQAMRNSKANPVLQSKHYAEKLESWETFSAPAQFLLITWAPSVHLVLNLHFLNCKKEQ